jgi:hypothetical protein
MRYLRTLNYIVSASSLLSPGGRFLLRELSAALVQSQGYVYRSCTLSVTKASGRQVLPGAVTPFLDLALCCLYGAGDLFFSVWLPRNNPQALGCFGAMSSHFFIADRCVCFPRPCRL